MYGTPQDIIDFTGVTPQALGLEEKPDPTVALNTLLSAWISRISSAIDTRLNNGGYKVTDNAYNGLVDICVRTVAKLVAIAQQQRTSPVVQIGEFAVNIINTAQVTKDLDFELKQYQRKPVTIFSSSIRERQFPHGREPQPLN